MQQKDRLADGFSILSRIALSSRDESLDSMLTEVSTGRRSLAEFASLIETAEIEQLGDEAFEDSHPQGSHAQGAGGGRKLKHPFMYLANAICKYATGDPEFKEKLREAASEASSSGKAVVGPGPAFGAALCGLADYLHSLPQFHDIGSAALVGLLLLLARIGSEAFCSWVADMNEDDGT